jgi:LPS export ABC transporter protein LptC
MKKIVIILSLSMLLYSCGNDIKTINEVVKADELGIEKASGVEMLYSDSAVVRVRVKAKEMLRYIDPAKPKRTFPKGLLVDFFDKTKQQVSKLTSKYAERDDNSGEVHLRDSVVIWNTKNERMTTDELWWNEPQSRIYTDKAVEITTPTETIHGRGFESNGDFTHWTLKEVTGTVQSKTLFKNGF